jgi:hypothetical protein
MDAAIHVTSLGYCGPRRAWLHYHVQPSDIGEVQLIPLFWWDSEILKEYIEPDRMKII